MSFNTANTGANVLASRDTNVSMTTTANAMAGADGSKGDVKNMEYHRQVLQSKMEAQQAGDKYISPSDEIMSPCTAKLNAFRTKQVGKVKPTSLFAQASSKRLRSNEGLFGSKTSPPPSSE